MSSVLAVDVGGTNIKCALFDRNLEILESRTLETPSRDATGKSVVSAITTLTDELRKSHEISAIGLAVPGTLDEPAGITRWAGNLGWKNLPIVSMLQESVGLPIAFKHDVRAGALAELRSGAMRGYTNGVFLPIGTGIACAIVLDGEIRSSDGFAGEVGHVDVNSDRACVCGKTGCLEATSSTLAISKAYEALTGRKRSTLEIVKEIDADSHARKVYDEAISGLVRATEILATIIAPEVIVLGGGLSMVGPRLIGDLCEKLDKELTFQRKPELVTSKYGIQSGMYGCGIMAWELVDGK